MESKQVVFKRNAPFYYSIGVSAITALQDLDGLYRVYLRNPKSKFKIGKLVALTKRQEKILGTINKTLLKAV